MTGDTVTIDRLGDQGDGIATGPDGRLFVPFTVPGDTVRIATKDGKTVMAELLSAGPDRVSPPCRHFGACGGCALQHVSPDFIARWKRDRIVAALAAAGLSDIVVDPTVTIPAGTRRRATLGARRTQAGILLGFAERASHRLIDLAECPVLHPALAILIPSLRALLGKLLDQGETADLALTLTETGIDLTLIRQRSLTLTDREALADFGQTHDLAQIAWRPAATRPPEPVALRREPLVRLGRYAVALPPGSFLQPSREGETALARLVMNAIGNASSVIDLFCGLGTFALPASEVGTVTAVDGDSDAIKAMQAALRTQKTDHAVTPMRRDLFREPLTPQELAKFGAAIVDPPRAGAAAQSKMLAGSEVAVIAMASCSPNSFARDAVILTDGGYRLDRVTPVDQFAWSTHVELVAVFRRT